MIPFSPFKISKLTDRQHLGNLADILLLADFDNRTISLRDARDGSDHFILSITCGPGGHYVLNRDLLRKFAIVNGNLGMKKQCPGCEGCMFEGDHEINL